MSERFDIVIVGGGPGGYVAALRAAQLGARTALVERDRAGGTCLLRGCIPTKALLTSAELYTLAGRGAEFGVMVDGVRFDLGAAQQRKQAVVEKLVSGVESLLKSAGVSVIKGSGRLAGRGLVEVAGDRIQARDIILATGSAPSPLPIPGAELAIDSDGILELSSVPERLVVIGGGVVGMEFGALFSAIGSQVTVLEMLPQILPMVEPEIAQLYRRHFEREGGAVVTEARVEAIRRAPGGGLVVRYQAGGESREAAGDQVLLAAGRRPVTEGLGAEEAGVALDRGRIKVDGHMRTSAEHVWAIGDVVGGIMLAHVASFEGVCAVENIDGGEREVDYHAAPNCIYTDPEIANVGLGEAAAREAGHQVTVGRFPLQASGRALTLGQAEGTIKVVAEAKTGRLLGVQMMGPRVTDLIAEATLAVQQNLTIKDVELTMHAHPTMAESLLEATLAADGRAIHIPNRARPAAAAAAHPQPASRAGVQETENSKDEPSPEEAEEERSVAGAVGEKQARAAQTEEPGAAAVEVDPGKLSIDKRHRQKLLQTYRLMVLIRRFEEQAGIQYTKAKIGGYCHLNLGEEATVVGGILALKAGDYIYTSYREHGHAIARGVDPKKVMAELFGRETGVAHGRGGSMHIFDFSHRFMGGYGIVGGHLPLAAGAAFTIKYRREVLGDGQGSKGQGKDVVFCMFGDGATNTGSFHESLNFAKVMGVPVIWFCINNQYGMGTAVARASAVEEIYKRACAYDMETIRVDGMDVMEVLKKTSEIVEKTREDLQPRFIEAVCYRFRGHSVVDPDKYRDEAEKEKWLKGDPVLFFQHQLEKAKVASAKDLESVRTEVEAEVQEIVRFAEESPDPAPEELYRYLYGGEWETVANG